MRIKGILFDFIGTTAMEKDPSFVNDCFKKAFEEHHLPISEEWIIAGRGRNKTDMVTDVLDKLHQPVHLVEQILDSFGRHLENNLDNFSAGEGAVELFRDLQERGVIIGIGTGLPRDLFEKIFEHMGWGNISFDYIGIAEEIGKGRPDPAMILDMLDKCNLSNKEFMKLGDTIADIQEGRNANVVTAVILSGTQDEKDIMAELPDIVIHSLRELQNIIGDQKTYTT